MLSINNLTFAGNEINFGSDSVFTYKDNGLTSAPIPVLNFVVDNAANKTVDDFGNYWVT